MNNPLISVITVVYNAQSTLDKTIQSVLCQEESLFEYWIIDGGSTDGSIELIQKYASRLAGWISEPDNGIYEAMNKGVDRAQGKWLYFLGADDMLEPNVLNQVSSYLIDRYNIVYGDVIFNNGRRVPSFFSPRILLQNTVHHQGAFYEKSLFTNFRYNTQLRILADYELNLKIYCKRLPTRKMPFVIACCVEGGASSEVTLSILETNVVRSRFIKSKFINWILSVILWAYYAQKKIRAVLFK